MHRMVWVGLAILAVMLVGPAERAEWTAEECVMACLGDDEDREPASEEDCAAWCGEEE